MPPTKHYCFMLYTPLLKNIYSVEVILLVKRENRIETSSVMPKAIYEKVSCTKYILIKKKIYIYNKKKIGLQIIRYSKKYVPCSSTTLTTDDLL